MLLESDFKSDDRYDRIIWNNIIREYYRPMFDGKVRLSIRFGERKDKPYSIYLIMQSAMLSVHGIDEYFQMDMLYDMIAGSHTPDVDRGFLRCKCRLVAKEE